MKKILVFLLCLLPWCANAYEICDDFEVNGIYYHITSSQDKTCSVTGYSGYSGTVSIPSSINYKSQTYSVTSIDNFAFCGCKKLQNIVLPSSVVEMGIYAFAECDNLQSFKSLGLTYIASRAFEDCISLETLYIPNVTGFGGWYVANDDGGSYYPCQKALYLGLTPPTVDYYGSNHSGLDDFDIFFSDWNTKFPFETCTLYVPKGCIDAYRTYEQFEGLIVLGSYDYPCFWDQFKTIKEYDPETNVDALDNALYIEPFDARIGSTRDIQIKLKTEVPAVGFQFDLEMPQGTTINSWAMSGDRLPNGATIGDKIASAHIEGNKITVACALNYNNKSFSGYDGVVATVNVTFGESIEPDLHSVYLTQCDFNDASGKDQELTDVTTTANLEKYKLGDANNDGKVKIGDATTVLNHIVGIDSDSFNAKAADANEDGKIMIGDVTTILNIIVNQ